jgi:hypothetical protein
VVKGSAKAPQLRVTELMVVVVSVSSAVKQLIVRSEFMKAVAVGLMVAI